MPSSFHSGLPSLRLGFLLKAQQVTMEMSIVCFQMPPMPTFALTNRSSIPPGAFSSLWPDLACVVARVVPTRVHPPSYLAWLTQTTLDWALGLGGAQVLSCCHRTFLIPSPPLGDKPVGGICFLRQCTLHPTKLQAESLCWFPPRATSLPACSAFSFPEGAS